MLPYEKPSPFEIAHHGILGQKWGKRNGPPYPLGSSDHSASEKKAGWRKSLDKEKKKKPKQYSQDVEGARARAAEAKAELKTAKKEYNKRTSYGMVYNEKATKELLRATRNAEWAKEDVRTEQVKERLNLESGKKSKRRMKLEEEYRKKGMTDEEAAVAAYKREKTEKVLMAVGAVTVAAIAGYAAYKYHDYAIDKIIDPRTVLHNISTDSNKGVSDAFYAAFKGSDRMKYRGMFGGKQLGGIGGTPVYDTAISLKSGLKVSSDKNGMKVLRNLVKSDPHYARELANHIGLKSVALGLNDPRRDVLRRGADSLRNGKINRGVWDAVSLTLTDHSEQGTRLSKKLYDGLKAAGYDAIMDANDKRVSGYASSSPIIVFNGASKAAVRSVEQLSVESMKRDNVKGLANAFLKNTMPYHVGTAAMATAATVGQKWMEPRSDDAIVRKYRQEHPNTELSYTEILRNERNKA